jgi:UDP-glucuronate 4-epimerase
MALFLFTSSILNGRPIDVYNYGNMQRDFTYIDDIVEGIVRALDRVATPSSAYQADQPDPATSNVPYRIFNIGNQSPVPLLDFIGCIERALGKAAEKRMLPMQDGDVLATYADAQALSEWVHCTPATPIEIGIDRFVNWYRSYYKV